MSKHVLNDKFMYKTILQKRQGKNNDKPKDLKRSPHTEAQ